MKSLYDLADKTDRTNKQYEVVDINSFSEMQKYL